MKRSVLKSAAAAALVLTALAHAASAQVAAPVELKDDENVEVKRADDKRLPSRFNKLPEPLESDRQFLIDINRNMPGAAAIKRELMDFVAREGMADSVLFETFGRATPASFEVKIGRRVPVRLAQAVIRAVAVRDDLSVTVYVYKDDTITRGGERLYFGYTQRVIIGSLGEAKGKPLGRERAEALLREGIGEKDFFRLISESR